MTTESPSTESATADAAATETTPARLEAAAALRRLGNAFVSHQADDNLLLKIAGQIDALLPSLEQAPERVHAFHADGPESIVERLQGGKDTTPNSVFPDCVVSGKASPVGMDANLWREGDLACMEVTLGPAFEGAPGRAHGGVVAALFDELMGLALSASGSVAFTGRLTVTYRAPTPIGELVVGRARFAERNDRKITITGELHSGDTLLAEGEGLFIAVDPTHFMGTL